jgi:hypothetical protein
MSTKESLMKEILYGKYGLVEESESQEGKYYFGLVCRDGRIQLGRNRM